VGLLAAFVILMVLFRALVPTMIPLLFAITAVTGAFLLLFLAARFTHFNTVTEILVPMIGLGVGIDYTLFIVTRFRQYLHDGLSPQEAAAAAGATAGRAVVFALEVVDEPHVHAALVRIEERAFDDVGSLVVQAGVVQGELERFLRRLDERDDLRREPESRGDETRRRAFPRCRRTVDGYQSQHVARLTSARRHECVSDP